MASWMIGNVGRVTLEAVDIDDAPIDPTGLRLKVKSPAGVVTVYSYPLAPEIVRTALGMYYIDILLVEVGVYVVRWESDAPAMGAGERAITVKASAIA